jgi:hypothetical protein
VTGKRWAIYQTNAHTHVVPERDLLLHYLAITCPCRPTPDADKAHVIVHHAADQRELREPDHLSS